MVEAINTLEEQVNQVAKATQEQTIGVNEITNSIVKEADQIIVIKQGRIVETGTHFSLIEQGGEYKKMVEMQTLK